MGFLHKLWDETLAGPTPESGLGKLRKYDSLSAAQTRSSSTLPVDVPITRSITIIKPNSNLCRSLSLDTSSIPDSPPVSTSTTPRTPSTPGTPVGDCKRFTRRKPSTNKSETAESAS